MIKQESAVEQAMWSLARNYQHLTDDPIILGVTTRAVCGYIGAVRAIDNLKMCPSCQMIEDDLND